MAEKIVIALGGNALQSGKSEDHFREQHPLHILLRLFQRCIRRSSLQLQALSFQEDEEALDVCLALLIGMTSN